MARNTSTITQSNKNNSQIERFLDPSSEYISDDLIWDRFKRGSNQALTLIYQQHVNALYNYGCQFTSNTDLIKDTIQDLFTYMIHNRERLSDTNSIKFYLFRSFKNNLIKSISKDLKKSKQVEEHPNSFEITLSAETISINQQIDEEKMNLIKTKVNELPTLQKEAVLLFFYEGMKYEEISVLLGIKIKSCRALIYRATESLQNLLAPFKHIIYFLLCFFYSL